MSAKPILYSYFRSSASWRVRIALAFKGIDYEYKAVSLIKDGGEQHKAEFKEVNPMEQVPALVWDGACLTQSLAIIDFIEDMQPEPSYVPKDPVKKAQARSIAETVVSGIQPLQNLSVLQKIGKETSTEWGHYWVDRGFTALEQTLQKTSGKYCVGDQVTIADFCLVPQLHNALRYGVDMSKFPTIMRVIDECNKLKAFQEGDFSAQPDTPEDLRKN